MSNARRSCSKCRPIEDALRKRVEELEAKLAMYDALSIILENTTENESSGCWEWKKSSNSRGYGWCYFMGKNQKAHRVSWMAFFGKIPKGICVLHSCDNPRCCNPKHLWLGTQKDNVDDMVKKGRGGNGGTAGDKNGNVKLSDSDAITIKKRYARGSVTQKELAREFGVSRQLIGHIVREDSRKHLIVLEKEGE